MILVGWSVMFLFGMAICNLIAFGMRPLEKIGFSLPVGIGVTTLIMMVFELMGLPLNNTPLLLGTIGVLSILFGFMGYWKHKGQENFLDRLKTTDWKKTLLPVNLGWLLLMACIFVVVYANVSKTLFWPVFIHDSVNGYDFLARVIMQEGTFNNSIFDPDYPLYSPRTLYPPLAPLSFSISYLLGHESAKIVTALFFVSNALVFYSMLKRQSSHLAAALFSLIFLITPEFVAFSALSSPNPICTFYCAMGMLSLYVWYRDGESSYFNMGMLSIMLALWTRSEALIFFAGGGFLILLRSWQTRSFKRLLIFGIAGVGVFMFWQLYLRHELLVENPDNIIKHFYWDGAKLGRMMERVWKVTFNTQFYGILVYLFLATVLVNAYFTVKNREGVVLLSIIFLPWLAYMVIYYQLDTTYLPDGAVWIESGYKRGLFYFFPLMLFYCANNPIADKIFNHWLKL
ncbi:MAG: hypothetical protein H6601_09095 [Flavobacteriales bacterium]|nr:hypothetical protein [Flavobacteriales bacterium]